MYYNIKIKCDDSELCLESDNIAVTQREMDIYFAHFFDVSKEYSQRINKMLSKTSYAKTVHQDTNKSINKEFHQEVKIQPLETKPSEFEPAEIKLSDKVDVSEVKSEIKIIENDIQETEFKEAKLPEIKQQEIKSEPIKFETVKLEESKPEEIKPEESKAEKNKTEEIKFSEVKSDEMVETEEIRTFTVSSDINFKNEPVSEKTDKVHDEIIQTEIKLKDAVAPKPPLIDTLPDVNTTMEFEQTPPVTLVPTPNIYDVECLASVSPYEYDTSIPVYDYEEYKNNEILNIFSEPSATQTTLTIPPVTETLVSNSSFQGVKQNAFAQNLSEPDFAKFILNYNAYDVHDEFLICAYYIKNILRQDAFTIKYINSKLFAATGRIADTALIQELINENYIKIIDMTDIKLYSITQEGENYFISRFKKL